MNQLIDHGEVRRGRIGIGIQDVTPDLAEALGLGDLRGAVISNVEAGSPADHAGLQVGDVVTAVDGRAVHSSTDLRNRIGLTPAGASVKLSLVRNDGRHELSVLIEAAQRTASQLTGTPFDGASLRNASPQEAREVGAGGVVVESITPGSRAARAGLMRGDMILAINRTPVTSINDVRQRTVDRTSTLAVEVARNGARVLLIIR